MAKHNPTKPFPNRSEIVGHFGSAPYKGESEMDEDQEQTLIRTAIRNVAENYEYCYRNWREQDADVKFIYETQWDEQSLQERNEQRRPALSINTLQNMIENVCGTARMRRFSIKALQKNGMNGTIPSSRGRKYSYADVMAGTIRDIERRSMAKEQHIEGLQQAVESGEGFMQLCKVRPVDDPRHVELRIQHIRDRWSVMIDHFAELPDSSDARWCAKTWGIPSREFAERFDKDDKHLGTPSWIDMDSSAGFHQWWRNHHRNEVRFLEYWWKEPVKDRELIRLVSPDIAMPGGEPGQSSVIDLWVDEVEDVLDELLEQYGYEQVGIEKYDSYKIMGAQMTHHRVLQEPIRWEGDFLPLIRIPGRKVHYRGRTWYFGIARYAKDACRAANYWYTSATERVAMAPKDEYIVAREQVKDQKNNDFLPGKGPAKGVKFYDHVEGIDPPKRQLPPQMPVAELQLADVMLKMVRDVTGIQDANLGKESNEVSGRAIAARAEAGATSTFVFIDNLRIAVEHMGRMIANMAPKIMGPSKLQRIILEDDTAAEVLLNQRVVDRESKRAYLVAPLAHARYEVECTVGPDSATQRQEMFNALTELGKNNPGLIQPLIDLILGAMDVPMANELARRAKMLVPRHMLSEEDQANLPPQQPTPEQEVEMKKSEAEMAKANAVVKKAESDAQIAEASLNEQQTRLQQRQLEIEEQREQNEQQRLKNQAESIKLERDKVALEKARFEAAQAEKQEETDAEVERRAKVKASETVDRKNLP